jgi:hypothetical protein
MCEPAINAHGIAWSVRAGAREISTFGQTAAMTA